MYIDQKIIKASNEKSDSLKPFLNKDWQAFLKAYNMNFVDVSLGVSFLPV